MPRITRLTQLGRTARIPASPEKARLETVPNPHPRTTYLVRFVCPEFTSLCPMTGQPQGLRPDSWSWWERWS